MKMSASLPARPALFAVLWAAICSPVVLVFLSSNFVNVGNLLFNVLFSRWMGPALFGDLAVVLTIKLAILGIFGAIQMGISQKVAAQDMKGIDHIARFNRVIFIALWLLVPILAALLFTSNVGQVLEMRNPHILYILLISFPFAAPLSIVRGVIHGQLNTAGILASANMEMVVRLLGSIVAWKIDLGIEGVTISISLSVIAGWAVIAHKLPVQRGVKTPITQFSKTIATLALPFVCLQAAQALLLDGDVFAAKIMFNDTEAGYIAALSLFQRIEFFACFALAAIMLPAVSRALAQGRSGLYEMLLVAALFVAVTSVFLGAVFAAPKLLMTIMVGEAYLPAAALLPLAACAAALFTLSYLMVTLLMALGQQFGIWLVVLWAPLQFIFFYLLQTTYGDPQPYDMLWAKLISQMCLVCTLCCFLSIRHLFRRAVVAKPLA